MAARASNTTAPISRPASPLTGISRDRLAEAVEKLIALLDALDGDPDLEPNGDEEEEPDLEPSLASLECQPRDMGPWSTVYVDDASSQIRWSAGSTDDREQDAGDEGEEPGAMLYAGWAEPDVVRVRRARR